MRTFEAAAASQQVELNSIKGTVIDLDDLHGRDDLDQDTKAAHCLGQNYVGGKDAFLQAHVCAKLLELARSEPGVDAYAYSVREVGRHFSAIDKQRGVDKHNPFYALIDGKTGYAGFMDSARTPLDAVHMDVFFLGNDNYMNGEHGNDMFRGLAPNATVTSARGPVLVLFYVHISDDAMPFTDDYMKHFSVTADMVRDHMDAIVSAAAKAVSDRLESAGL